MFARNWLVTPGQLTRQAELYFQLGQLMASGLPLLQSLEHLERHPPSPGLRRLLQPLRAAIQAGSSFSDATAAAGRWVPLFDQALLQAGEHTGRLDTFLHVLAEYYRDRARTLRQMLTELAYPVFLFHFAVCVLPFPAFFLSGNLSLYLLKTLGVLLPLHAIVLLVIWVFQTQHGPRLRALLERCLHPIPLLGGGRRALALARLSLALEALLNAGVSIIEAWDLAGAVSGSPYLQRTIRAWQPAVRAGRTPAEAVIGSHAFPDLFENQYHAGEVAGKLDENLRWLHQHYQEEGLRKIHLVCQWLPRFIYLLIALFIAYKIVSFYSGYFQQVNEVMQM
ncbi:MAG TPA: type II secretion system F family protein [Verrucomicrobiota bacterium]|nr:type II secretion system F family protein [Verrucomicrobiota bacterium]HNT13854.1 type II secretion system F family protein [Verrucomicrobiota bacterium]